MIKPRPIVFVANGSKKSTREVSDEWEKLKKSLKDYQIDLKKKLVDFEEWANIIGEKGIPNAREEHEKMKAYRKEVLSSISFGREAGEFLESYNGEFKNIYSKIMEIIKELVRKQKKLK
ncbi:uncharacterized protein TNIN_291721 [Trichonephila inaurata madagascariensis]|uniref:Uncharacterized protein n=1 Tax=Trichonephila inaurata madagascariensis TaxID=2747483 RepID=A0A8X6Y630_9ARAC|nr:uncharacterized protein TNIN_291721 [Trichonephila inaurata madagascariensis]